MERPKATFGHKDLPVRTAASYTAMFVLMLATDFHNPFFGSKTSAELSLSCFLPQHMSFHRSPHQHDLVVSIFFITVHRFLHTSNFRTNLASNPHQRPYHHKQREHPRACGMETHLKPCGQTLSSQGDRMPREAGKFKNLPLGFFFGAFMIRKHKKPWVVKPKLLPPCKKLLLVAQQ